MRAAWPPASTPTERLLSIRAPSTSTSRSTAPLRSSLRDPAARSAAQSRCRHVLVDEFQDLNPAHMLLIRLLSAPTYNTFGVGDDDQVIYGYAGATPEYLINFEEYFVGAQAYALEVNYRCPPAVVAAAKHVLSYNSARVPKTITTPEGSSDALLEFGGPLRQHGPVAVMHADAELLAQTAVAAVSAWRDAGVTPDEIAVLSRVNSTLLPVQVALSEAGIPSNAPLSADVLKRTGIATTLAYLRMGLSPHAIRREDIAQTIRRPSRGIAPNVTKMLSERATTSVSRHQTLGRPSVRARRGQALRLRAIRSIPWLTRAVLERGRRPCRPSGCRPG